VRPARPFPFALPSFRKPNQGHENQGVRLDCADLSLLVLLFRPPFWVSGICLLVQYTFQDVNRSLRGPFE
jgi:hypothetical protein